MVDVNLAKDFFSVRPAKSRGDNEARTRFTESAAERGQKETELGPGVGKEKRMERLAGGSQKCILGDVNKECV